MGSAIGIWPFENTRVERSDNGMLHLSKICIVALAMPGGRRQLCGIPRAIPLVLSLLSGDIGHYDDNGNLYIVDRLKELLKYKGFQVTTVILV